MNNYVKAICFGTVDLLLVMIANMAVGIPVQQALATGVISGVAFACGYMLGCGKQRVL